MLIRPDDLLLAVRNEGRAVRATKPRASSLGHCIRQQMYAMAAATPSGKADPVGAFTAEQGRHMESLVELGLNRLGWEIEGQQDSLPEGYVVSGHPDGILVRSGQRVALLEQKHVGLWRYIDIYRKGLYAAQPGYLIQSLLYADALQMPTIVFIVTAQDSGAVRTEMKKNEKAKPENRWVGPDFNPKMQVIEFATDEFDWLLGAAKNRAEWITEAVDRGVTADEVVREADPERDNFPCGYCDWQERCQQAGRGVVEGIGGPWIK